MKNYQFRVLISAIIVVLLFSFGCTPQLPARYPAIELPISKGMSTSIVIDDIIEIPASKLWHKTIELPPTLEQINLAGWCVASGGARNDIKVLVLNDVDFYNWKNFGEVKGLYQSKKTTIAEITSEITTPGKYHLVISNRFSVFSSKKVVGKVYLYWSVKPVTYTIKADDPALNSEEFQIPKGSSTTFLFMDTVDTSNFRVTKDGKDTPVSANINGPEVKFIAPSAGNYEFSCGNNTIAVKGSFKVVAAQPFFGQGWIIPSSLVNSPPSLETIQDKTYDRTRSMDSFIILASDPDDDALTYFAHNVPAAVSGYDENGNRIWQPAATLDKNSGVFSWNESSGNLLPGKYYIRIEVSDGILSDYQDVIIRIR